MMIKEVQLFSPVLLNERDACYTVDQCCDILLSRFHIGSQIGDISVGDAKITSQAVSKDAGNIYNNTNSTMGTS